MCSQLLIPLSDRILLTAVLNKREEKSVTIPLKIICSVRINEMRYNAPSHNKIKIKITEVNWLIAILLNDWQKGYVKRKKYTKKNLKRSQLLFRLNYVVVFTINSINIL